MAWYIMNSLATRSYGQYGRTIIICVRNALNCANTHHGFLHHDKASAHTTMLVLEFLGKNKTVTIPQTSYSADLALADFFPFPKLKTATKGKRFSTIEKIKENIEMLDGGPNTYFCIYFIWAVPRPLLLVRPHFCSKYLY